jgi:glutamate racemase
MKRLSTLKCKFISPVNCTKHNFFARLKDNDFGLFLVQMVNADQPLLVFDSGVGGLSILAEIRRALPKANLVYAADNAWLPYGTKSEAEIAARVPAVLGRLVERYRPRLVVIACNTAATIALAHVRAALDLPIVGTVPAIKPAALATQTGVIGLLGTAATIRQPYVDRLEAEFAQGKTLLRYAAPELVLAAESALRGDAVDDQIYDDALIGLKDQTGGAMLDHIILGCTHFPLVKSPLQAAAARLGLRSDLNFIDSGEGIARRTVALTQGQDWPEHPSKEYPSIRALFTLHNEDVQRLMPALGRYGIDAVDSF